MPALLPLAQATSSPASRPAASRSASCAQLALAELPLAALLEDHVIPYETDEVTRLIVDAHDAAALAPVAGLTVGEFRDWLLSDGATGEVIAALAPALMPEMAAAVSKLMRLQDLVLVARKLSVVTRFRTTIGPARPARDPPAAEPSYRRHPRHCRCHA